MIANSPKLAKAFCTLTGADITVLTTIRSLVIEGVTAIMTRQTFINMIEQFTKSFSALSNLLKYGPYYFIERGGQLALQVGMALRRVVGFFINPSFALPGAWSIGQTMLTTALKLFATWMVPSILLCFVQGGTTLGLFFALKCSMDAGTPLGFGAW